MEWNEEEVAGYIVGRLKKDHGKDIPSAIIKLILDYEGDYMHEAGMTMSAEEHDALLDEENKKWDEIYILLEDVIDDLIESGNGRTVEQMFGATENALRIRTLLKSITGGTSE